MLSLESVCVAIRPMPGRGHQTPVTRRVSCHARPGGVHHSRGRGIGWPYAAGTDQGIDVFSASKPSKIRHIWRKGSPSSRIEIIRVLVAITTNHQPVVRNAARPSISLLAGSLNCAAAFTIASFWSVALTSPTHRALAPAQRIVHAGSGGGAAVPAEAGVLPWRDHRTVAVTSESPFASGSRPRRRRASKDAALAFMRKHVGSPQRGLGSLPGIV